MKTKLTLTIDNELIPKAKEHARQADLSLSQLIENNLRAIILHRTESVLELEGILHDDGRVPVPPEEMQRSVEEMANELSRLTGESKSETVRRSLAERWDRLKNILSPTGRGERLRHFLENEVWSRIPKDQIGKRLSKEEEDVILGYGPEGV